MFDGLKKRISKAVKFFSEKEEKKLETEAPQAAESIKPESSPSSDEKILLTKNKELDNETILKKIQEDKKIENDVTVQKIEQIKAPEKTQDIEKTIDKEKPKNTLGIDLSLSTKIKSVVFKKTRLKESEVDNFLEDMRVSMLESDVSYNTAEHFAENLKKRILETEIDSKNIDNELFTLIRESLLTILSKKGVDLLEFVKKKVSDNDIPVKILFLGPNGTGKTTTIAKLTYMLKNNNFKIVISASDTFRAAAIEQSEYHAKKLDVPIVKSNYGTDPASVAFDAVAYAKARNIDIVMIDSAGRQETNRNLISEIQKMQRVIKPDFIIYVGESVSGNAISEQISEFKKFVNINGIILTKLDCDAKGGNAISISDITGIPILFFGIGEKYTDLLPYDPNFIINMIVPKN